MTVPSSTFKAATHRQAQERGRAVALVVVRHGPGAALLHRQAGLGPVERLDLALLVDRQHDGVRRRVDPRVRPLAGPRAGCEADHVAELVDEARVVGELELPHPVRLEAVGAPDAVHRRDGDAGLLGHHAGGPVGRLGGRVGARQRHDALRHLGAERRNARRPRLVAQETVVAFLHEPFLPAPDAGLRLAGPPHDLHRAQASGRQQHDLGPPGMFLGGVAVLDEALQTTLVGRRDDDGNPGAHAPDSHAQNQAGIRIRTQPLEIIH